MDREELMLKVGALIREARKTVNVSQGALARALGIDQGAVSQWETGKNLASVERLRQVEQALNLTPGTLTQVVGFLPLPGNEADPIPPISAARDLAPEKPLEARLQALEELVDRLLRERLGREGPDDRAEPPAR